MRPGPTVAWRPEVTDAVIEALRGPFRLRIVYRSADAVPRVIEPHGLLLGHRSYLVARQPLRSEAISSLTKELSSPDLINVYAERYIKSRIEQNAHESRRRAEIEARIATIAKDNDRLLDLLMKGMGDQGVIDGRMKAQGRERDELKQELVCLPVGSNVILHPTAIKHLADKLARQSTNPLSLPRAKLEMTLHILDDMGELAPIVRELIRSVTLYRDEDDRLVINVEASLVPFLHDDTAALPKSGMVPLVAEEGLEPPTQGL